MSHDNESSGEVIFIGLLALVHGGFWLLVGLGIGHVWWGGV